MPPQKRKSAYSAVLKEVQQDGTTVEQPGSETGTPLNSQTVAPSHSIEAEQYYRGTAEQPSGEAGVLRYRETEEQLHSSTVTQTRSRTVDVRKERKVTFYLTKEQEDKLTGLEYEYFRLTGKPINRNDIVRYLVDQCTIATITQKPL